MAWLTPLRVSRKPLVSPIGPLVWNGLLLKAEVSENEECSPRIIPKPFFKRRDEMRSKLELQRDPMWQTLFHKLTPFERDFIIEVSASVRAEAFEDCARIVDSQRFNTDVLLSQPSQSAAAVSAAEAIRNAIAKV